MSRSRSLPELVERYLELQQLQVLARRREDTRAFNRVHDRVWNAMQAIEEAGPEGRRAIEKMLDHREPMVRFRAAERVLGWDKNLAIPVLGRLLIEPLPPEASGYERFSVRCDAQMVLDKLFDNRTFQQNNLIEPLRAYGVELPWEEERPWFH